ncbi:MAG: SH3 domain-containing protein [Chloroflexi bacterium]|nr:SH3 domain-containing protein [Chloroflexota bacterium]MCI0578311.1 SH3 domain-containing protein [Chloroflexota bacterium]MCI0649021.1 SH3 domain-containing protein [Chloroflexota bacterium]MCI0729456.1 SH3 domain-containing protein [Chloroflexota bacterium]
MSGYRTKISAWWLWSAVLLVLFLPACRNRDENNENDGEGTEVAINAQTPAGPTARPSGTARPGTGNGTPAGSGRPTPTLRPTGESPQPAATAGDLQVRVIFSSINVRNGPGTDQRSIAYLYEDDVVEVLEVSDNEEWYRVRLEDGTRGWVAASVVETVGPTPAATQARPPDPDNIQLRVVPSSVNLRQGPGTEHPIWRVLFAGDLVTAISRTRNSGWLYVETASGHRGWIAGGVLNFVGEASWSDIPVALVEPTSPAPTSTPSATPEG